MTFPSQYKYTYCKATCYEKGFLAKWDVLCLKENLIKVKINEALFLNSQTY